MSDIDPQDRGKKTDSHCDFISFPTQIPVDNTTASWNITVISMKRGPIFSKGQLQVKTKEHKRLAILSYHWLSSKGGPTTYVFNLLEEFQKDFDVYILTPDKYRYDRVINLKGKRFLLFISTLRALVKLGPEIIHVHGHEYMLLSALLYKKLFALNTRIIFTFHTQPDKSHFLGEVRQEYLKKKDIIKKTVFNWALNKCDFITSVSKSLANNLKSVEKLIIKKSIIIIPPGTHVKKCDRNDIIAFKKRFHIENRCPIICMIGVFKWDWKVAGIRLLVRAMEKVIAAYPYAKLIIVGDGTYRNYLENVVAQLSLTESVIFTGYCDNIFIPLSASDIYCHISLNEGLPLAILEAMAAVKPIIAAKAGGIPEVIFDRRTGLLVNPNEDDIAKAIIYLLENPEVARRLAQEAFSVARFKYNWKDITNRYRELYLRPLGRY